MSEETEEALLAQSGKSSSSSTIETSPDAVLMAWIGMR